MNTTLMTEKTSATKPPAREATFTLEELTPMVLALPKDDREELAELIECSLEQFGPEEIDAAWHAELDRRVAEIESGEEVGIPWEETREKMRRIVVEARQTAPTREQ